tara:strand:+ start:8771 stop:9088 length:318 start_codon:yes stop_codon:yes gene_type:complete
MVHYIALYKLKPDVSDEQLEDMIRSSRSQLLKIPEVLNISSGKRITEDTMWPFYVAIDFESLDKMEMYQDDPIYIKFKEEVVKPYTTSTQELLYEMEPGKDVKYS